MKAGKKATTTEANPIPAKKVINQTIAKSIIFGNNCTHEYVSDQYFLLISGKKSKKSDESKKSKKSDESKKSKKSCSIS